MIEETSIQRAVRLKKANPNKEAEKKPGAKLLYTEEMKEELRRCRRDPMYFLTHYYYIQHPKHGKLLFEPYGYQSKSIEAFVNNRNTVLMLSRQMGKTTMSAGYLLWYGMFHADKTVLVVANIHATSMEILHRIRFAYEECPDFIRAGCKSYAKSFLEFDNGSRIVARATTARSGLGLSVSLLYCDEFSKVKKTLQEEFWAAISPTLSTGGGCIITSTPDTEFDLFAEIWRKANKRTDDDGNPLPLDGPGSNNFYPVKAIWSDNPTRDEKWLKDEKSKMTREMFSREHECEFGSSDSGLIDRFVLRAVQEKVDLVNPTKVGEIRWYSKPKKHACYLVSLDPSFGVGGDYAAIQVFQLPGMTQVAEWMSNRSDQHIQVRTLKHTLEIIDSELRDQGDKDPQIFWTFENNTVGEGIQVLLKDMDVDSLPGILVSEKGAKPGRKGLFTSTRSKNVACQKFKLFLESGKMSLNSRELVRQLNFFVPSGGSFGAKLGEHDDLIAASLMCIRLIERVEQYTGDDNLTESMKLDMDYAEPPPMFVVM